VAEEIAEPGDLGDGLVADDDEAVASTEDAAGPVAQAAHFAGDVRSRELAEAHELVFGVGDDQEVEVVTQDHDGADGEAEEALRACQYPHDQVVEPAVGGEQEAGLEGLDGDLVEQALEDGPRHSCHAWWRRDSDRIVRAPAEPGTSCRGAP
jgi:hypothetical protein